MGHRTEQSQSTTSIGQTDSTCVLRTLNRLDERETLPCIRPKPDSFVKTQQKQTERQSIERDMCPISYRSKDPDDMDLPFKNNSRWIICFSHKASASFSRTFIMATSRAKKLFYCFCFSCS